MIYRLLAPLEVARTRASDDPGDSGAGTALVDLRPRKQRAVLAVLLAVARRAVARRPR